MLMMRKLLTRGTWLSSLINHHFIKSGFLFDSAMPLCPSNISSYPTPSNAPIPDASPYFSPALLQSFFMQAVTESEVLKELLKLDPRKTSGSDVSDPFCCPYHRQACLSFLRRFLIAWKAATVRHLCKGVDQADPNCYRPLSICPVYQKCWKNLSINNRLAFLMSIVFSRVCNLVSAQVMEVSLQP